MGLQPPKTMTVFLQIKMRYTWTSKILWTIIRIIRGRICSSTDKSTSSWSAPFTNRNRPSPHCRCTGSQESLGVEPTTCCQTKHFNSYKWKISFLCRSISNNSQTTILEEAHHNSHSSRTCPSQQRLTSSSSTTSTRQNRRWNSLIRTGISKTWLLSIIQTMKCPVT